MNLEFDDEQRALRDSVRGYLARISNSAPPVSEEAADRIDTVWAGLVGLGATALLVPEQWGGDGLSMTEAGLVCEELGAALEPGPWLSAGVAAPRALTRFGADGDATAHVFAGIADGSVRVAVAPPSGAWIVHHDAAGGVVSGHVDHVADADAAGVLFVVCDGPGPVLCAVSMDSPAVGVTAKPEIDPSRPLFEVRLDGAAAQPLAVADPEATAALVDDMTIAYAADALGAADRILQMTVDYAKVRRQFGVPIGSFQAVAHLCADMYETVELVRSGVAHALWAADFGDPAERHLAALRLKAFAGRLVAVGDAAIQVFGGVGFTWEHDAHRYLRRLLGFSRHVGDPDRNLVQLGRETVRNTA